MVIDISQTTLVEQSGGARCVSCLAASRLCHMIGNITAMRVLGTGAVSRASNELRGRWIRKACIIRMTCSYIWIISSAHAWLDTPAAHQLFINTNMSCLLSACAKLASVSCKQTQFGLADLTKYHETRTFEGERECHQNSSQIKALSIPRSAIAVDMGYVQSPRIFEVHLQPCGSPEITTSSSCRSFGSHMRTSLYYH